MLTVVQIRALKPRSRPYKAFDSDGLFLLVQPSGSLLWRFRYRKFGIEGGFNGWSQHFILKGWSVADEAATTDILLGRAAV